MHPSLFFNKLSGKRPLPCLNYLFYLTEKCFVNRYTLNLGIIDEKERKSREVLCNYIYMKLGHFR